MPSGHSPSPAEVGSLSECAPTCQVSSPVKSTRLAVQERAHPGEVVLIRSHRGCSVASVRLPGLRSFRSFRGQLVVVFVGLFAVILATCFLVVAAAVRASARSEINEELRLAGTLFVRQLEARSQQLLTATRLLSGDFALKTAAATADQATTRSVLENHRQRIEADVLLLLTPEGNIAADTRGPGRLDATFPLPRLLEEAEQSGEASRIAAMDGGLYRLAFVPLLAPVPIAWLAAGFSIDDRTAADLRRVTGLHISFFRRGELATTFNTMLAGLRDRERVRAELERAERLKRFFSPQLAELLSAGDEPMLASHRREITVLFCDLHGFTAFAEKADPEDVMRLLRDYHATVGALISRYEGTLERFTGDGLMVFFNDPVPCPDPATRAVRMAIAMRDAVQQLLDEWRRRGHTLGFGTGVDMGYATVGRIGFEGRFDYAAIGTVTNLSARLCQEASDGQILVSQRVYAEVESLVEAVALGALSLRGFARPLLAFSVVRLRAAPPEAAPPGTLTRQLAKEEPR